MTIDANIVIAYLGGDTATIERIIAWRREGKPLFLPAVAEAEVLSFARWTSEERRATEIFLQDLGCHWRGGIYRAWLGFAHCWAFFVFCGFLAAVLVLSLFPPCSIIFSFNFVKWPPGDSAAKYFEVWRAADV